MWNPPPHRLKAALDNFYAAGRNALLSLLFPCACAGCARLLRYPLVLCEPCNGGLKRIVAPYCKRCGAPLPQHWRVEICPGCKLEKSPLTRTRSAFEYDGLVRQMIRAAKYHGRARNLNLFAEQLLPLLLKDFPRTIEALVPVPMHSKREWDRRFNHAEVLADQLHLLSGIPLWRGLTKIRLTLSQSKLTGKARRRNLQNAFFCKRNDCVPKIVLLIDDVVTTGATLNECARTLRRSGVRRVYALTIARAVLNSSMP